MGKMSVKVCRGRIERGRHEGSTHVCESMRAIVLSKNTQGIQGIYKST